MRTVMFSAVLCCASLIYGQQAVGISGVVKDGVTKQAIENAVITIEGFSESTVSDAEGYFILKPSQNGELTLQINIEAYAIKRIPVFLEDTSIDLGPIFLQRDMTKEKTDNLIALTENDLSNDEETISISSGLLQSSRDIFLNRAAFDFGQAFFRVRGYDAQNGTVLINGIPLNKFYDGRPQWNNFGGLNDVLRNQEFTNGLSPNRYTFGGILGNTNIDTRPSVLRPGVRLSSSISNRTYRGRLMATYNSGLHNKLAYTVSASRRWADEGYVEGTLYDAYSFFGALEYRLNTQNSIALTSIVAKNRRGRSAAITQEVFNLKGSRYNPYWGSQNGKRRNSRTREIFEPILMINHHFQSPKLNWATGVAYQFGTHNRSRLAYFNAPNPDPTYYRYLPSFYVNGTLGADFTNAELAEEGFLANPQMNWDALYSANNNGLNRGKATYLLYDDVISDTQITVGSSLNYNLSKHFKLGFGGNYRTLVSENYAQIKDLLGAEHHEDMDTFSNTLNDVHGSSEKAAGDKFNYHYNLKVSRLAAFGQVEVDFNRWKGFASVFYSGFGAQREGLFQNERFLDTSLGKGDKVSFSSMGVKSGVSYFLSGRHWLTVNGGLINRPPTLQNTFVNPRENNLVVPEIQQETIAAIDLNYFLRLPDLTGRVSAFYTKFQHTTDINFFYVDSGYGSDFVQEVITGLDKLHKGIEFGFQYELSSNVKLSAVGNLGEYVYANDPFITINFDTSGNEEGILSPDGSKDLGVAKLKGLKLAQGPQKAFALGVEYRDPKYWWIGATANYLGNNYLSLSNIARTQSFLIDPETGEHFPDATTENVAHILRQQKMGDFYLLNLVGGKSWIINKKYVSAFVSVNNLFNEVFKSGGYEQGRNGNYGQFQKDNLSGSPSFGPKYWYGYGRTYFLNLAVSF